MVKPEIIMRTVYVHLFKFLRLLPVVSILLLVSVQAFSADKLTVATLPSPTNVSFMVALESGFFKDYGLEVLPVQFSGGIQTTMALISGDVQITTTGGPAAINAKLKGGSVVHIGTTVGVMPFTFYASNRIVKPSDLKGKKIGVSGGFGGVFESATRLAVQKLGFNSQTDVTLVQMSMPLSNSLTGMALGSIDGTILYAPESLKAAELGFKPLVDLARSGTKFLMNGITTTPEYIKRNRETVKRFMMGSIAGVARLKADRVFTMNVLKKYLRISDPQQLAGTYDYWASIFSPKGYVDPEEIETYLSGLKDRGAANPQDFIDNSIVAELDREGFIDAVYRKYTK
jgi:NitT/TauT family transport system substrate-binding protein